jgi:hypothetical protein
MSASLQTARASVRDANVKKRKAEALLKSSIEAAQSNFSKAQKKSSSAIEWLEKNANELSQYSNFHKCDLERQKVNCSCCITLFSVTYHLTYQLS